MAGMPDHFQNWGDPISETLARPETHYQGISSLLTEVSKSWFRRPCAIMQVCDPSTMASLFFPGEIVLAQDVVAYDRPVGRGEGGKGEV
jgi:hypothetical protein